MDTLITITAGAVLTSYASGAEETLAEALTINATRYRDGRYGVAYTGADGKRGLYFVAGADAEEVAR